MTSTDQEPRGIETGGIGSTGNTGHLNLTRSLADVAVDERKPQRKPRKRGRIVKRSTLAARNKRIFAYYNGGLTVPELSAEFVLTPNMIRLVLRRHGVVFRESAHRLELDVDEVWAAPAEVKRQSFWERSTRAASEARQAA